MNPIYRFELSQNGTNTRAAKPNYNNDLAIDYELEQNQEFYRGKLSGKLTFQQDDYAYIKTAAFDTQFDVVIFISYDAGATWAQYWKGKFFKTDCQFNDDDQTAIVTPSLNDRYNDVLSGLEKEYNLIDLVPEIQPVKYDKRPMVQVYVPGQSVIGCFLSGMWWEQECEPVDDENLLTQYYHFAKNKTQRIIDVVSQGSPTIPESFNGAPDATEFVNGNYKVKIISSQGVAQWQIVRVSDNTVLWIRNNPTVPGEFTLQPVSGSGATNEVKLYVHDVSVFARYVTDLDAANGVSAYEIPDDDIVANNRNYHYVLEYDFPDTIIFYSGLSETPTKWGLYQPGKYYQQPYILGGGDSYPISRAIWGRTSLWFFPFAFDWIIEQRWRKQETLKDAFPISSVIAVLLGQIAPSITHSGTTDYSVFLYAENNPILNISQRLMITPKSNVINSGYDQPAQKAPITLKDVLDMLRDCFRCYWFIDEQNRFRIEHISWFMRGGSYNGTPVVGTDLTQQLVTRNGKPWSYARNQYQFDKPDMAARYQFGWMDDVTELFEGYPIDIVSKYVNPDNIEQIQISKFTSDVDYILLNPNNISKDGFVLLGVTTSPQTNLVSSVTSNSALTVLGSIAVLQGYAVSDFIAVNGNNIRAVGSTPFSSALYAKYCVYDENQNFIRFGQSNDYIYTPGDVYVRFTFDIGYATAYYYYLLLPYVNYQVDATDHYLQNAYVAFCILQEYYAFDMPAMNYRIHGVDKVAQGIKKLKRQTIKFPVFQEPNMTELVKTELGNGTIEKMSVNLSSRNANTTLKYDTE